MADQPLSNQEQPVAEEPENAGNQISITGKVIAAILLTFFSILSVVTIIAYWPDKLPTSDATNYDFKLFNMMLCDSNSKSLIKCGEKMISFNTIILILVAAGGFLGSMIHVASSFTAFVGGGQFKRNWILWYIVKPFTASALAIVFYFVLRAGLLSSSDTGNNINIYGVMALATLTGMFTQNATDKLKSIFDIISKPKEKPDPLTPSKITVTDAKPDTLIKGAANTIIINGDNLDKGKWAITVNGNTIDPKTITIAAKTIQFSYTPPADATEAALTASTDGIKPFTKTWKF